MKPLRMYIGILCATTATAMILTVAYPYLQFFGKVEYKELLRSLVIEFGTLVAFLILLWIAIKSPDSLPHEIKRESPA